MLLIELIASIAIFFNCNVIHFWRANTCLLVTIATLALNMFNTLHFIASIFRVLHKLDYEVFWLVAHKIILATFQLRSILFWIFTNKAWVAKPWLTFLITVAVSPIAYIRDLRSDYVPYSIDHKLRSPVIALSNTLIPFSTAHFNQYSNCGVQH